jgi:hypothetical protein
LNSKPTVIECDVAVIGGGLGGVAAALSAAEGGANVVLTEATDWPGGQATSQAVSALDEHALIETVPGTQSYAAFRQAIRQYYQKVYQAPGSMPDGAPLNPGNAWVSRLCFEPKVGVLVINQMLSQQVEAGRLRVWLGYEPQVCTMAQGKIQSVQLSSHKAENIELRASIFLDATELGDLLPLAGLLYTTGAETQADTGEAHASQDGAHPERVQSFTSCFIVEFCAGENHTIRKPRDYERFKALAPYSLVLRGHQGERRPFNFFQETDESPLPFWTYRRLFDAQLLSPGGERGDLALINWNSNDYRFGGLIDPSPERRAFIMDEAGRLSLGFLYWLQTECPRDEGGFGYPELRLASEAVGTPSGLAMAPYIREARRIHGLYRIVEQDIGAEGKQGVSQAAFYDSVGIGWYSIDLHPAVGDERTMYAPTIPFQIPLGALIPIDCENLLACCKNICSTHLTNGAYRLHPVEWSIGEAAGSLATYCLQRGLTPGSVRENKTGLQAFQNTLKQRGVQIEWPRTKTSV